MLAQPIYAETLTAIHQGSLECTHEALDQRLGQNQRSDHLRGLLIEAGLLPPRNPDLTRYERWVGVHVDEIDDASSRDLIRLYARWSQQRHLHRHAESGTLTTGVALAARQRTRAAIDFALWANAQSISLADATQADLDRWLGSGRTTRRHVASFVNWARSTRRIRLRMPPTRFGTRDVLSQRTRLELLARYFHDNEPPVDVRITGLLVLLFAMPVSRIVTLTRTDLVDTPDGIALRHASGYIPLPGTLPVLIQDQLAATRLRTSAAHQPPTEWVFPGRLPGQHLTAQSARDRLHRHGLPRLHPGRNSAIAALVKELPTPVAAEVAGIGVHAASNWAAEQATNLASYPHHRHIQN